MVVLDWKEQYTFDQMDLEAEPVELRAVVAPSMEAEAVLCAGS